MLTVTTPASAIRIAGYFPSWGIHAMNYHVTDIPADQLTHVIYAFANVTATADCVSTNASDDQINLPLLAQLKQQHPKLATLISVGGASNSKNFPNAASNAANQAHFAQSCVQFMKQNGFDGIDIDWEYPTAALKKNFTSLLAALRKQLDAQGVTDRKHYLLTIAAPAGASNYANLDLSHLVIDLDWINLMTYDFTVVSSKTTDFVAPLRPYDPQASPKHAASNVDAAVQAYLKNGVPANKIVVGTRFIGTGWRGVASGHKGLYQVNQGPAPGTWDAAGAAPTGEFGYQDLEQKYIGKFTRFFHQDAQVPWLFQQTAATMISYEDPQSLIAKVNYVVSNKLGGVMIWNLAADDRKHTLVKTLAGVLAPLPPGP